MTHLAAASVEQVPGKRQVMFGGLGALTPILLNLIVVDFAVVFGRLDRVTLLSYFVRVTALFAAGVLVAWLHKSESDPRRLFELGIAAPALLTAFMNGTNVQRPSAVDKVTSSQGALSFFVAPAYAQPPLKIYSFAEPAPETTSDKVLRGLTGRVSQRQWFVLLKQSYPNSQSAASALRAISTRIGRAGRVYEHGGPFEGFAVALGYWMTQADAARLERDLRSRGVEVFSWPAVRR